MSLAQVDDVNQCSCLDAVHMAIYEKNNLVDGAAVEKLLKQDSLVLTVVSVSF